MRANLLLLLPLLTPISSGASPDELYGTIAALDTALFDAYNGCDVEKFRGFLADDLEFYHDKTGLTRTPEKAVEALQMNICGKTRRDLVPGTLEVYPLDGYGAVELGVHRFCELRMDYCGEGSGDAKFIHLWREKGGVWKLTRVISYDH